MEYIVESVKNQDSRFQLIVICAKNTFYTSTQMKIWITSYISQVQLVYNANFLIS